MASTSVFTHYSLGVAAENKSLNSRHLAVSPTERSSALDGEITFNPQDKVFSGFDKAGDAYELKVTEDVSIEAEWLPFGSNRVTPPDVRRGEPVMIYRMADTDRYYWRCLGLRDDLRRLETVIYAFNANPDEGNNGIDLNNCYFFEISTHTKQVTVGTSQANGEPFGYGIQLDTGEGKFTLEDTIGNIFHLDSARVLWEIINSDQTHVRLDRKNVYVKADENIEMEAGNSIMMRAGNSMLLQAGDGIQIKAGNSIYSEASSITSKASSVEHDTPNATYTGSMEVGGSLALGGGLTTGTGGGGSGSCTVGGNISATEITCTRLTASERVDAPNL